jgi:hypothetical protein
MRIARGLLPLLELANLRATPLLARTVDRKLANFARDVGANLSSVVQRTDTLVDGHQKELASFLASRPKHSQIRQLGEALS